jgi:hypothetical protein
MAPNRAKGELGEAKIPTSAVFSALHLHAFTHHEKRLQLTSSNSQFQIARFTPFSVLPTHDS